MTDNPKKEPKYIYLGNDTISVSTVPDKSKMRPLEKWMEMGSTLGIQETLPPGYYVAVDGDGLSNVSLRSIKISTDDLIVSEKGPVNIILQEIQEFFTKKEVYLKYGFSHKRGYLLHGPPGCGKSSITALIAREFFRNGGIVLMADNAWYLKNALQDIRKVNKDTPLLVLLEDIDAMIEKGNEADLLAILDGQFSVANTVNIATTNYPEKLDGRLTDRPSRFDRRLEFGLPDDDVKLQYLKYKLTDELTEEQYQEWLGLTKGFSLGHIKELVVSVKCMGGELHEVAARIKALKNKPKSESTDSKVGFSKDIF